MTTQVVRGIHLPTDDAHFAGHLEKGPLFEGKGTYQYAKIEKALGCVKSHRIALDIGAHVGLWSRVLAAHFLSVIAFEPVPSHLECFRLNAMAVPNIMLLECALGREQGLITVAPITGNSGNAHVTTGLAAGTPVDVRTLDSFAFDFVDFIKIDVEGFELPVIEGGEGTIRRDKPAMVVEQKPGNAERYGYRQTQAVELLQAWGAKVLWIKSGDYCLGWDRS